MPSPIPEYATQEEVEAAIQAAVDASSFGSFAIRIEREADDAVFTAQKGTPNERNYSSSTVKPIVGAILLWCVHKGYVGLDDLLTDHLPEWDVGGTVDGEDFDGATGSKRDITLRQLASFTSGITAATVPNPWSSPTTAPDLDTFRKNMVKMSLERNASDIPAGSVHAYNTDQHDLLGLALVEASPYSSWSALVAAFVADTGLFPGLVVPNPSPGISSAGYGVNYTLAEFCAFLKAIFAATVLTPELCATLYADALEGYEPDTTAKIWYGEDWHFGLGIWREYRGGSYPLVGFDPTRIITVGNALQVCYRDSSTGVRFAMTIVFGHAFEEGLAFVRSIDGMVAAWAGFAS